MERLHRRESSAPPERENLAGLVERVTFHNDDSGFCVLRVKARDQRDLITVVGHAAAIGAGEFVQASGRWINDRTHGVQFRADFLRAAPPTTAEGIEKYLASGMIRGIGPIYARKLVKAFREQVFDVIEQTPARLKEVDGIGPKRADSIVAAWADQKAIREIMIFLHSHGVGTSRAVRIFKTYGADAIRLISENPYRLARDIRGIGFKSADQIASKLGIKKTAMIRARAGIGYALTEAMDEGHCGLPLAALVPMAVTLLDVPAEIIETALDLELQDGEVIADGVDGERCIFLAGLHRAEWAIAARIKTLSRGAQPWPAIDAAKAMPWVESKAGITLADSQRGAVQLALSTKVLVITGGLGARSLNIDLQKALNPPGEFRVERFGSTYGVCDKVMQVENDYDKEVYNGDLGVVRVIDPEASEMVIEFDGRLTTYSFGELDEVALAYATTIHKSQGSEYPAVVIPLTTQHYPMLQRNLLYTAVTRGKRLVVIVGQKKALAIAVKGNQTKRRWSKLKAWLHASDRSVGAIVGRPSG